MQQGKIQQVDGYTSISHIISSMKALESKFDAANPEIMRRTVKKGISRILEKSQRIRPAFSQSWIVPQPPEDSQKILEYVIEDSKITLYKLEKEVEGYYHIIPFEYRINPMHMAIINMAIEELMEKIPEGIEFTRPEQARNYVEKDGFKIISKLANKYRAEMGGSRGEQIEYMTKLAKTLVQYTAGFGVIESLLKDPYIQDIYIDAPAHLNPVYVVLGGLSDPRVQQKCRTNVYIGTADAESLLSRFRYESGRPFSEAHPFLECDLESFRTRVTVIGRPLSPEGIAIALRRHSTDPWTLLKLIYVGSLSPLAAGVISFLVDGRATILVAGSRGAGKTSLVGAIMLEFPQNQRILTIEDTLELPTYAMKEMGYKVQSMLIQSPIGGEGGLSADEALRISLRLGESAIVLGEVRGQETKTLYEAMRAGTAGSSVLGTIHGNTAKSVYERVVHDIGIPPKSFNATDIVIVAGLRRPHGKQAVYRRTTEISELIKDSEGEFRPLLVYSERSDTLIETEHFRNSKKIKEVADSWGLTYEEALENIRLRAKIREDVVEFAKRHNNDIVLRARWVMKINNFFWNIIERREKNYADAYNDWKRWFERSVAYA